MCNKKLLTLCVLLSASLLLVWCNKSTTQDIDTDSNTEIINEETNTQNEQADTDTKVEIKEEAKEEVKQEVKVDDSKQIAFSYENKKENFSLDIPQNWTFKEDEYNFSVILYTPEDDDIRENLWVTVQEPQVETNINEYYTKTVQRFKDSTQWFKEIESKDLDINWLNGKSIVYKYTEWSNEIKAQQTILMKQNKIFVLQYTATKDTFKKYSDTINKIIESFKVLD